MILQDQAIEIAKRHHGNGFELLRVTHGIPASCHTYGLPERFPDDTWCVFYSANPGEHILASSRATIISKDTGEILYDGSAHDEG